MWTLHAQRLIDGCIRFHFPPPDINNLYQQLLSLISESGLHHACGKIVISRGTGGRGYSISGCDQPTTVVSIHPYPQYYEQWQSQGIVIGIAEQRIGFSPILAGMKSLNRLEQVFLKADVITSYSIHYTKLYDVLIKFSSYSRSNKYEYRHNYAVWCLFSSSCSINASTRPSRDPAFSAPIALINALPIMAPRAYLQSYNFV